MHFYILKIMNFFQLIFGQNTAQSAEHITKGQWLAQWQYSLLIRYGTRYF